MLSSRPCWLCVPNPAGGGPDVAPFDRSGGRLSLLPEPLHPIPQGRQDTLSLPLGVEDIQTLFQ